MFSKHDLEEFIGLVSLTEKKKSPEVRLTVASARRIADSMTFLLLELDTARRSLTEAESKLKDSVITSVELDGGSF